jgi:hypothetical protein
MVDLVEPFHVLTHQFGSVGSAEEIPVLPLRIAKSFGRDFVLGVEVKLLIGWDLVGQGEEREADAAGFVVEVEALGSGGTPVVACRELVRCVWRVLVDFDKFFR